MQNIKKIVVLVIILFSFQEISLSQDQHYIDSLELLLKRSNTYSLEGKKKTQAQPDTVTTNILGQLSKAYWESNPDKAMEYAKKSLVLAQSSNFKKGIVNAYNSLGKIEYIKGEFIKSIEFYKIALKVNNEIGDRNETALSYKGIGQNYIELGNFPEALQNLFTSLKTAEEIKDSASMAYAYLNIGITYYYNKKLTEALKNWQIALKIFEETNDEMGSIKCNANIGNIYLEQGNYIDALLYYEAVEKIFEKRGNKQGIALGYNNIANIYFNQGNFQLALQTCFKALKILEVIGDKNNAGISCNAIGEIYTKQKEYKKAEEYLNKGLLLSQEVGNLDLTRGSYEGLVNLCSEQGNYQQALKYYKLSIAFRDSMFNGESARKTATLQLQYDTEKKEKHIILLTKESQLQQIQIQKQKVIRNSFIAGSILLILLIVVLINRNKLKRTVEMEKMRSRLSRDLHDDIGSTLSSINILSRTAQNNLQQTDAEKTKASLEKINERSQRLLDNMSDIIWNINPGNDTIEEVMSRMREYAATILEAKNIDYIFDFPKDKMDCKLTMEVKNNMYLIFKEAVNNLSKYSGASKANLTLTFDEKNITLKVEDNGKGFNENEIKHRGGLSNMQLRAEEIKGVIKINSVVEKGTVIELSMPRYC